MHITIKKSKSGDIIIYSYNNDGSVIITSENDLLYVVNLIKNGQFNFHFWGTEKEYITAYNKLLIYKALCNNIRRDLWKNR